MIPVKYSNPNQAIVDGYNNRPPAAGDFVYWAEEVVNPVRKEIKDHYINEQEQHCCYCDKEYPTNNNSVWDGDHIIPKKLAARFLFEPKNLAASCKDCNIAKSESEVRVRPSRKSFPDKSAHYTIVHPHFDVYSEHIRWYGDAVRSLSPKGSKLISMCNLTRFGHLKIGADPTPPNRTLEQLLGKFMDPLASRLDLQMALAAMGEYVKSVPQD
ncbi:HNH endonuclease [Rhizobium ruizarguesonis]